MTMDLIERIKYQIKQLSELNTEGSYESDECLKILTAIDKSYTDKANRSKYAEVLVEFNYADICSKLLRHYNQKFVFSNDRVWFCTYYLLHAIWNYTDVSKQMCLQASDAGYIPILLLFIKDGDMENRDENEEQLFKISINILHNLAQQPETKVVFRENNGTQIVKSFTRINHEQLKVLGYLCLAHIVNEDETRELNDASGGAIKFIINNLKECYKKDDHRFRGIAAREYLSGLCKLAINRENKFKMLECGVLGIFKEILKYDNPHEEQKHTLTSIWSFCFEEKIRDLIKKDKELLIVFNNLYEHTPSEELRTSLAGIFYTLNELPKKTSELRSARDTRSPNGHIMISYNASSRDICVKLKERLKNDGFRVWIDVEQIQGSALQSMAEAVENAVVILICITEKYYQSPNCRLEAEYAVKLNKPVVPLLMQAKYVAQGWLGISIGSKIYHNFAKYSIDEKYPSLLKEISCYYINYNDDSKDASSKASSNQTTPTRQIKQVTPPSNITPTRQITPPPSTVSNKLKDIAINNIATNVNYIQKADKKRIVLCWTNKDVKEWIAKMNITSADIGAFDDLDGQCLVELHDIKIKAPEFFYNLLKDKLTSWRKLSTGDWDKFYKLSDFLKFSSELSKLLGDD